MAYGFGPTNSLSSYLPVEIQFPEDLDRFREILTKRERLTADILNIKENANYELRELLSAQLWFTSKVNGVLVSQYGYRISFDLVGLNGGPIGASATFTLSSSTIPAAINIANGINPTHGFGACTNSTGFYFINDPNVYVETNIWTNASQTITITNSTGSDLTQCYWCMEYLKF